MEASNPNTAALALVGVILMLLFGSVAYGMYNTFGAFRIISNKSRFVFFTVKVIIAAARPDLNIYLNI